MNAQAMAAVPIAAVAPVTSFRKSRLVTSGMAMVSNGGGGRISHLPLDTIAFRPGAGRAKPRADPGLPGIHRRAAGRGRGRRAY